MEFKQAKPTFEGVYRYFIEPVTQKVLSKYCARNQCARGATIIIPGFLIYELEPTWLY